MERLQKLTEGKKDDFMKPDTPQTTDYQSLHSLLMEMTGGQISDHEVATVARNYQRRGDETVSSENHISMTQEHQPMKGVLSPDDVRAVFVSLRIPINGDLMRAILSKAPLEEGLLRYREFVAVFKWRDNPAPTPDTTGSVFCPITFSYHFLQGANLESSANCSAAFPAPATPITEENLISVAQGQQRKVNHEDFVKIINQCLHHDRESGHPANAASGRGYRKSLPLGSGQSAAETAIFNHKTMSMFVINYSDSSRKLVAEFNVRKTQINIIAGKEKVIIEECDGGVNRRRKLVAVRKCAYASLYDKVYEWFSTAPAKNIPLTGRLL
ncbi:hypothetical protein LSAT2_019717 [Lamellibrachia satsuma]|nr:hypothetical protein LSAT2_019717 [Lamellibrachia satsuma]